MRRKLRILAWWPLMALIPLAAGCFPDTSLIADNYLPDKPASVAANNGGGTTEPSPDASVLPDQGPATDANPPPSPCEIDLDCGEKEQCVLNECVPQCREDRDCKDKEICVNGGCTLPGCNSSDECPNGEQCEFGKCIARCAVSCEGKECGDDGCGGQCGDCTGGSRCETGKCVRPCQPRSCAGQGLECGKADDGCGGFLDCGSCSGGKVCNTAANKCVSDCTPIKCQDFPDVCGRLPDGCGGILDCGGCPGGKFCNDQKNLCESTCTPKKCESSVVQLCGPQSDGCGGNITCADCKAPLTCGGGGQPGVCGCKAQTCQERGFSCGGYPDGCGGTINCGSCAAGSCVNGKCECTPSCDGKSCGPDGCGGLCSCAPGTFCENFQCKSCPVGWTQNPANGHCYFVSSRKDGALAATDDCVRVKKAHPVFINDAAENEFVAGLSVELMWLGMSDWPTEGKWRYSQGTEVTYFNWAPGEPNNQGDEDCAIINWGQKGKWADVDCFSKFKWVCELEKP
ncbi:MAG: hypothetical protein GMKNLPBB_02158 [Myxococcota bacterium]|nr:hypothetical protein [Myxococcota bacterium]